MILGSLLWGAKVNASFIQRSVELKDHALTSYEDLSQILDESISVVRRISWELTPEAFHYLGLSESIKKMCSRLDGKGQEIRFLEDGKKQWNDDRALQVFRVTQELINNAVKHSTASHIFVSLAWKEKELLVNVNDNGSGFNENQEKKGVGLWNINQRISQLQGKISIGNPPTSTGTEINITIPLLT
ncbi:MAG: ATP-binding protein [Cyclobacteriaceae bacterium]